MKSKLRAKKPNKKVGQKSPQKKKYPLRGKPVIYRDPFKGVFIDESQTRSREPGIDKGKVVVMPDFDEPLSEFD